MNRLLRITAPLAGATVFAFLVVGILSFPRPVMGSPDAGAALPVTAPAPSGPQQATPLPLDLRAAGYTAQSFLSGGEFELAFPYVARGEAGWTSILAVRNVLSRPAPITLIVYDVTGASQLTTTAVLTPNGSRHFDLGFEPQLPEGFVGSAVIRADDGSNSLVGAALVRSPAQFGDAFFAYNAPPASPRLRVAIDDNGDNSADGRHTIVVVQGLTSSGDVLTVEYYD